MGAREAEQKLKGTVSSDKNEILFKDFGINYNKEPECFKKGTILYRDVRDASTTCTSSIMYLTVTVLPYSANRGDIVTRADRLSHATHSSTNTKTSIQSPGVTVYREGYPLSARPKGNGGVSRAL
jgi:hypothetical protein